MNILYENSLSNTDGLQVFARQASSTNFLGSPAMLLDGLVVFPRVRLACATVEVEIAAAGASYPGVAFNIQDPHNYELAYGQPHTSGQWDAIQYEPVFHASNTWQQYHGPAYQQTASVPANQWIKMRLAFSGSRLAVWVDDQPPLVVERLAHEEQEGWLGLWTYLPAHYRNLKVWDVPQLPVQKGILPSTRTGAVTEWLAEGFGRMRCEPTGILNVNRYLSVHVGQVRLLRSFEVTDERKAAAFFGFSDELTLELDGQEIFSGETRFCGMDTWESRGYVDPDGHTVAIDLKPGRHTVAATLKASEYFGWGMAFSLEGENIRWLPILG